MNGQKNRSCTRDKIYTLGGGLDFAQEVDMSY
jgi:hypothetical protein